jgi:diacylglycerol kinase family enzyme
VLEAVGVEANPSRMEANQAYSSSFEEGDKNSAETTGISLLQEFPMLARMVTSQWERHPEVIALNAEKKSLKLVIC